MSNKKYTVHIQGTGQLNGQIRIDEKFEVDSEQAKIYRGQYRKEAALKKVQEFYPGVEVPNSLGINVYEVIAKKTKRSKNNKSVFKGNILLLPFRIIWVIIKWIFRIVANN